MKRFRLPRAVVGIVALALAFAVPAVVHAVCDPNFQSCSMTYGVSETQFGSGSQSGACSYPNNPSGLYCADMSAGDLGVGNTTNGSSGHQAQAGSGSTTNRNAYLEFLVTSSSTDLGVLSVGSTKTAEAAFSVKTYLAGGYIVTTESDPPTGTAPVSHQLATPSTPTASTPGTEQFGMNLVNNTTGCGAPANFGADPVQKPDNTFSFGTVASGYNTCGLFKYAKGDTVAQSTKSSGETDYKASYIFNISNITPDGQYTFHQVLVATSTF